MKNSLITELSESESRILKCRVGMIGSFAEEGKGVKS